RGTDSLRYQSQVVLTRLEEQPLRSIAEWTGGTYTPARTDALDLADLFRVQIESRETHGNPDDALPLYRQRYPWFFGVALVFLSLEMFLGQTWVWQRQKRPRKMEAEPTQPVPPLLLVACALLLSPWLLGGASLGQPEDLIRQGNAAFASADFVAAID